MRATLSRPLPPRSSTLILGYAFLKASLIAARKASPGGPAIFTCFSASAALTISAQFAGAADSAASAAAATVRENANASKKTLLSIVFLRDDFLRYLGHQLALHDHFFRLALTISAQFAGAADSAASA